MAQKMMESNWSNAEAVPTQRPWRLSVGWTGTIAMRNPLGRMSWEWDAKKHQETQQFGQLRSGMLPPLLTVPSGGL